jgi:ligand-binding SRPBCC domain-containing protein
MWIRIQTLFNATPKEVFDISRSIDLHLESGKEENEKVVAGRSSGLMIKGESVTWEARHLGVSQRMTVLMEETIDPTLIITRMVKGPFAYFVHYHRIEQQGYKTLLTDDLFFKAPFGIFGWIAEWLFLKRHLTKVIQKRNEGLKKALNVSGK